MIKKSVFGLVLALLIIPVFSVYAISTNDHQYTPPDNGETDSSEEPSELSINGEIDILSEDIKNSLDTNWRSPANNRKNAIINKFNALKAMISSNNLEEAYDKLLYDIKPKLTGLKTDEEEKPWEDGIFNNPWVISNELKEEYRIKCNEFLTSIAPTIPDNEGVIEPA